LTVTYVVDPALRLIRTRCSGDTTLADVLAHFSELRATTSLPESLDVLLDLTEMTSLPSLDQLEAAAASTASLTPAMRWGSLAIVVGTETARETASVYAALVRHYFAQIRIFTDGDGAEEWLAAQRV